MKINWIDLIPRIHNLPYNIYIKWLGIEWFINKSF